MNNGTDDFKPALGRGVLLSQGLFLAVVFGYFFFLANYVLRFQETQSLFIFSGEYLRHNVSKPGGPLGYAAKFLTQFYAGKVLGPLILSVILTLPGVIIHAINRRVFPDFSFSWLVLLIPSCLLFLMQANNYHMMEHNLGFLLILLYYLFSVSSVKTYHRILVLILFPLVYYLAGAYGLIFTGMFLVHVLFLERGKQKYVYAALSLALAAVSFLVFWKLLFLQPFRQIIWSPLPLLDTAAYKATFLILTGYSIFFPLVGSIPIPLFNNRFNRWPYSVVSKVILLAMGLFLLIKEYDPQTAKVVELERAIYAEEWDEAIRLQEETPSRYRTGQYFYNIALSETGQLCDRLFGGAQDFGPNSLVLPWAVENLTNGAYFYLAIGLPNEAHRWAYEDMVVYGYRPQNIKLLAKTSLIYGDYRMAKKYANILKRTFYYRGWAKSLVEMADNPDLISSHPELMGKLEILPKSEFFTEYNQPENNLPLLLEAQPDNKKALEYLLAGLLLTKNLEGAANSIQGLKEAGYTRIPRHLEEAAMIFFSATNRFPDLGGLAISSETQARFEAYSTAYGEARRNPPTMREELEAEFGDTFWFYLHFE